MVDALPAPYDDRNDFTVADPFWTVLLKDEATSAYELRYFGLEAYSRSVSCMEAGIMRLLWALSMIIVVWLTLETDVMW